MRPLPTIHSLKQTSSRTGLFPRSENHRDLRSFRPVTGSVPGGRLRIANRERKHYVTILGPWPFDGRLDRDCYSAGSSSAFLEVQQVPLPQQALAKGAAPPCEQFGDLVGGFCTCPVAL